MFSIIDYDGTTVLLECTQTENRTEIVRGGSVAVEAVSISER